MILIVNDAPGVSAAFRHVLSHVGVESETVETYTEAVSALARKRWTGFILDIFLPDRYTGLDVLESIRAQPAHAHTPAAVITADLLLDDGLLQRITAGRARLYMGVFDRPAIETICLELLLARRDSR